MRVVLFTIMIIIAIGCTSDFGDNYDSNSSVITVNSILSSDKIISVSILNSNPYPNSKESYEVIKDATVRIYENGELYGELMYNPSSGAYEIDAFPIESKIYSIEIEVQGHDIIEAETWIPENFYLEACYLYNDGVTAKIGLTEIGKEESYWIHFQSKIWYKDLRIDSSYFVEKIIQAPITESRIFDEFNIDHSGKYTSYSRYLRISDNVIDSIQFEVTSNETPFWFQPNRIENPHPDEYLDVIVFKASEEMDHYWKAIFLNYLNSNFEEPNPFYEPISGFSNIKNGTGIFAGINTQRVSLVGNKCFE